MAEALASSRSGRRPGRWRARCSRGWPRRRRRGACCSRAASPCGTCARSTSPRWRPSCSPRGEPFFDEHTIYGAAIAFVIPFVAVVAGNTQLLGIDKKYRIWIFLCLILLVAGEYFAYSRAGVLSLMASVLLYFFLKLNLQFKHLLIGLACILSLTFVFGSEIYSFTKSVSYQSNTADVGEHLLSALNLDNNVSNLERVNRWKCAVRMFGKTNHRLWCRNISICLWTVSKAR